MLTYFGKFIPSLSYVCIIRSFSTLSPSGEGYRMAVGSQTTEKVHIVERGYNQSSYHLIFQSQEIY